MGGGDCYNREHLRAQSWTNEDATEKTDLHHVFPTDGWVNSKRSNYAFGEVSIPTYTSGNGGKLGPNTVSGYNGTVFEPIDEYKVDIARALMYVSVRYYGEDSNWSTSGMTDKSDLKAWAIAMLPDWHRNDPVSDKERSGLLILTALGLGYILRKRKILSPNVEDDVQRSLQTVY